MNLFFDNKHSETGFTLIEILTSVVILSVVLTAVYSTFFLSHRAIEGMDEAIIKLQESRKAIDILRREIESILYSETDNNTLLRIEDKDFYGKQASNISFTAFTTLRPGLSRISYYIDEDDKSLTLFKKVEIPYGKELAESVNIMENVEAFTIEARYNDQWVKTWDTDINKYMPDEIKISLSLLVKGKTVTLFDIAKPRIEKPI